MLYTTSFTMYCISYAHAHNKIISGLFIDHINKKLQIDKSAEITVTLKLFGGIFMLIADYISFWPDIKFSKHKNPERIHKSRNTNWYQTTFYS